MGTRPSAAARSFSLEMRSISSESILHPVRLVWQWVELERALTPNWTEIRVSVTVPAAQLDRAASLLGGANPLRRGDVLRLFVARTDGFGPEAFRRALLRLDRQGIGGTLELEHLTEAEPEAALEARTLVGQWDAVTADLPLDWSDMLADLVLRSSDQLERAALLASPVNPLRVGDSLALRFRAARRFGYGVSAGMVGRCLARLDEENIPGVLRVLNVLCDTDPVGTQGPVWRVGGRSV